MSGGTASRRNYRGETLVLGSGAAIAADRLRNHVAGLFFQAYGSLKLTDANLFYANQEHRIQWQAELFQELRYKFDRTFDRLGIPLGTAKSRLHHAVAAMRRSAVGPDPAPAPVPGGQVA